MVCLPNAGVFGSGVLAAPLLLVRGLGRRAAHWLVIHHQRHLQKLSVRRRHTGRRHNVRTVSEPLVSLSSRDHLQAKLRTRSEPILPTVSENLLTEPQVSHCMFKWQESAIAPKNCLWCEKPLVHVFSAYSDPKDHLQPSQYEEELPLVGDLSIITTRSRPFRKDDDDGRQMSSPSNGIEDKRYDSTPEGGVIFNDSEVTAWRRWQSYARATATFFKRRLRSYEHNEDVTATDAADNKDPSNRPGQSQGSQQPPNNFSRPFVNQNRPVQPEKLPVSPGQKPQNVLPPQGRQAHISGPPGEEIQNQTGKPLTVPGSLGAGGQNRPILPPPYSVGGSQGLSVPKTPQIPTQPPPPLSNPSRRIPSGPPALPERPPPAPPAAPELPPAENAPAPPSRPKANPVKIGPERVFLGDGEYVDLIPLYRSIYERPYFHMISRKSSKQLLEGANCGTFLIRPSKRSNNPLTLSLRYNQQTYNINIRQRPDNLFALGSEKPNEATFSNIEHIVATYTREPLKLQSGEKTLLLESPRKDDVYVRL